MVLGLAMLGALIVIFGAVPASYLAPARMRVYFVTPRADGLTPGSQVKFLGVGCGTVEAVQRDTHTEQVIITALIDQDNPPPANVVGRIHAQFFGGGSSVDLERKGPQSVGKLLANAKVETEYVGVDLLPAAFNNLASELEQTARQIRTSGVVDNVNGTLVSIRNQVEHAGKIMDDLQKTIGDEQMHKNLQESVANFRTATDSATRVGANLEKFSADLQKVTADAHDLTVNANATVAKTQAHIDDLSRQLGDRLQQLAKILENFQSVSAKVDKGEGTAGQLINDPKLYQALVDTSRELKTTITQLNLLIEQWKEEGVTLKMK